MLGNPHHAEESEHGLVDRAIAALAGSQQGLITTRQLLGLGLSERSIAHRVRIGRLQRLYRGVYAVGHLPIFPSARALAAVLACGPGAALSHGSAATLWGIDKHWASPLEVTAPTQHCHRGLRAHRSKTLTPGDVTLHFGVPVTTPARTLLDNATRLTDLRLARAVDDLRVARFLWLSDLAELLAGHPRTRATNRLLAVLADGAPTRSEFERAFVSFAKRYGLPEPAVNTLVAGHEADALFPDHKLVVELDGWDTHSGRANFESDRDRDADLLAAGIATVRITWKRMNLTPEPEATRLHAILARRSHG